MHVEFSAYLFGLLSAAFRVVKPLPPFPSWDGGNLYCGDCRVGIVGTKVVAR